MQEIELKFQIPEAALAGVEAELQALAGGPLAPLPLRAAYFDTPDRRLSGARMALRVRQEGDDWVQTLKAGGSNTMMRLEDNQAVQPPEPGAAIVARLGLHQGAARAALVQALGWDPQADPQGHAVGLNQLYRTDIARWRVQVTVGRGTPDEGVVELALDLGAIHAGPLRLPVRELEIEAISGSPMAVITTGRDWVRRHGLWLDTQTKAHRGDRLVRQAEALEQATDGQLDAVLARQDRGEAPLTAGLATALRPAKLDASHTLDQAWRAGLEACLEHMTAHLSELATLAPMEPGPAAYEWRRSLRQLRALGRLWAGSGLPFPAQAMNSVATLARQLGWWRDQEALAWLPARLCRHGGAALPLPHPARPQDLPDDVIALARSAAPSLLCLDLLAALLHPPEVDANSLQALGPWLSARLAAWSAALSQQADRLDRQDSTARHRLRRRLRQLRDLCDLHAACWSGTRTHTHRRRLDRAVKMLGRLQDEAVAHDWYQRAAETDGRYAEGQRWLARRQARLTRRAAKALTAWQAVKSPW